MKRILSLSLSIVMLLTLAVGCTKSDSGKPDGGSKPKELTVEERTTLYKNALESAIKEPLGTGRPPLVTGDEVEGITFDFLGIKPEDLSVFALDIALINIRAYGIAAVYPAEGKSDAVMEALKGYIENQKQSFENYLVDQYEIAKNAKIEKLDDGTILMVMCEGQDEVFTAIKSAINEGTK